MSYPIREDYITKGTKRRPGSKRDGKLFVVAHDTGNPGSTAAGNVGYFKRSANDQYASAQYFVDDVEIVKCIPREEKAYHVIYDVTTDNKVYGDDANDAAIGVELCYGGKIDMKKAYAKYVWLIAYLLKSDGLNYNKVTGHFILDPARKVDPVKNGLAAAGKTWAQFLADVKEEYQSIDEKGKAIKATASKPAASKPAAPSKKDDVYRVIVGKNQIGAFASDANVLDQVAKALKNDEKVITVERVL